MVTREPPIATPRSMFPTDSWEFAVITMRLLKNEYDYATHSYEDYQRRLAEIKEYRIYDRLPDPEAPYGSVDALLQAELGATESEADKNKILQTRMRAELRPPLVKNGEIGNGRVSRGVINTATRGSTNADYLTSRIARDRPDILEDMKAGKYRSVRAAAIDAGIIKVPTSLEVVQGAFLKLSKDERETFLIWVSEQ